MGDKSESESDHGNDKKRSDSPEKSDDDVKSLFDEHDTSSPPSLAGPFLEVGDDGSTTLVSPEDEKKLVLPKSVWLLEKVGDTWMLLSESNPDKYPKRSVKRAMQSSRAIRLLGPGEWEDDESRSKKSQTNDQPPGNAAAEKTEGKPSTTATDLAKAEEAKKRETELKNAAVHKPPTEVIPQPLPEAAALNQNLQDPSAVAPAAPADPAAEGRAAEVRGDEEEPTKKVPEVVDGGESSGGVTTETGHQQQATRQNQDDKKEETVIQDSASNPGHHPILIEENTGNEPKAEEKNKSTRTPSKPGTASAKKQTARRSSK